MNHAIAILPLALLLGAQDAPPRSPFYTLPDVRIDPRIAARPATPLGAPGSWVRSDDYPAAAMAAHVTGTTDFRLDIDKNGAVRGCTVTQSSGSELLDKTACELLSRRARFNPAVDRNGRKTPGTFASRFRWALPDTPMPFGNWLIASRIGFNAAGQIEMCSTTSQGSVTLAADPCAQLARLPAAERRRLLGDAKVPVAIDIVEEHRVEGMPVRTARDAADAGTAIFRRRIAFEVDATGEVVDCKVLERSGEDLLHHASYQCHPGFRYPYAGKGGKVTESFSITRRSEPFAPPVPPPPGASPDDVTA